LKQLSASASVHPFGCFGVVHSSASFAADALLKSFALCTLTLLTSFFDLPLNKELTTAGKRVLQAFSKDTVI